MSARHAAATRGTESWPATLHRRRARLLELTQQSRSWQAWQPTLADACSHAVDRSESTARCRGCALHAVVARIALQIAVGGRADEALPSPVAATQPVCCYLFHGRRCGVCDCRALPRMRKETKGVLRRARRRRLGCRCFLLHVDGVGSRALAAAAAFNATVAKSESLSRCRAATLH